VAAWLLGLGVLRILDSVTGAHLAPYWLGAFPVLVLILITNLTRSRGGSRQNEKEPPR